MLDQGIVGANLTATNYHDFTEFEEIFAESILKGLCIGCQKPP
jgi:hypothetical protein